MSTTTLVLNFAGWILLTVVVAAVAVGVPMFLDRPARRSSATTVDWAAPRRAAAQPGARRQHEQQAA